MGKETRKTEEIVENTKTVEVDVSVEEVEEREEVVFICDLCGNEENPEDPSYHELVLNPTLVGTSGGKRYELGGVGKSIGVGKGTLFDQVTLTGDGSLILCPYCYNSLFGE